MKKLPNTHPGEVLQLEFLEPLGVTAYRLAQAVHIPQTRVSEIVRGNRRITADTALRLSRFFGTTPQFWLGLQNDFDLEAEQEAKGAELERIEIFAQAA